MARPRPGAGPCGRLQLAGTATEENHSAHAQAATAAASVPHWAAPSGIARWPSLNAAATQTTTRRATCSFKLKAAPVQAWASSRV